MQQGQKNWREYFRDLMQERSLRQELARELRVNPATLTRWTWITRKIEPQRGHLERLVSAQALSHEQRETLRELLTEEYPDVQFPETTPPERDDTPLCTIPHEFYKLILRTRSTTDAGQVFSTIVQLVQQQIASHFQAEISTPLLLLTPPVEDQPVRSLYYPIRPYGHRPVSMPQMCPILIGIEVSMCIVLASTLEPFLFTEREIQGERRPLFSDFHGMKSALVLPLRQFNKVGGCLLVLSKQADFFTETHLEIASEYSSLLTLALSSHDFYDQRRISFCIFPEIAEQLRKEQEHSFMLRMKHLQGQALSPYPMEELERLALQQLEEELLQSRKAE